jgi:hypothetical protein
MQSDGGSAECVGLNNIGAGGEILDVNLFDNLRLGQLKKLQATFEIFPLPRLKPFSAIILLRQFIALDHRSHRAVEKDDALAEEGLERMELSGHVQVN